VAAYRRIKEIEKSNDRLILRMQEKMGSVSEDINYELEILHLSALNIKETIKSSIADWADIIGEELELVEKIEMKENEFDFSFLDSTSKEKTNMMLEELRDTRSEINKLVERLPASLKMSTTNSFDVQLKKNQDLLYKKYNRNGYLELDGFWEDDFEKDICDLNIGDKIYVSISDVGSRSGAFIAYDEEGKSVGVITNNLRTRYQLFSLALIEFLGKSKFQLEITEITRDDRDSGRHYFKGRVIELPKISNVS
jgi:hypothetical protein